MSEARGMPVGNVEIDILFYSPPSYLFHDRDDVFVLIKPRVKFRDSVTIIVLIQVGIWLYCGADSLGPPEQRMSLLRLPRTHLKVRVVEDVHLRIRHRVNRLEDQRPGRRGDRRGGGAEVDLGGGGGEKAGF